ncbi:DUF732 domain-containing protein [Mycobacterium saskatchewanense]|uniref:DUF732 domain-containing protein n=1 Tax=Mycobacterium saskatchewanense TaxID=220927 RepID=A0AAJ3NKB8_9MYCO|nr:DUF732 domain-containing protein [Mycobacterium saskatchewanense]ORW64146.1 hypothetical protein AWC23_26235 [Mycobacterium saskatchewanense]
MIGRSVERFFTYAFSTLAAAMFLTAALAHADDRDADFTNYLAEHGIHLGTASQTGNMARTMCQDLEAGYNQSDEVKQLTEHQLSQAQAEFFVGAATAEYCPKYHSPGRGGS